MTQEIKIDVPLSKEKEIPHSSEKDATPLSHWEPTVLVLSGGGIKGFAQLGSLMLLHHYKLLDSIKIYVGTSVGAMICYLLAIGYTPFEIFIIALHTTLIEDVSSISLKGAIEQLGIIDHTKMLNILEKLTEAKFGRVLTLLELKNIGIHYAATTVNLHKINGSYLEFLDYNTYPNLSGPKAVTMSSNIPGIFSKLEYNGCVYIDGGFADPLPIDYKDDGTYDILAISTDIEREGKIETISDYFLRAAFVSMNELKRRIKTSCTSRCKILELRTNGIGVIDIGTNFANRVGIYCVGFEGTYPFIKTLRKDKHL